MGHSSKENTSSAILSSDHLIQDVDDAFSNNWGNLGDLCSNSFEVIFLS